MSSPASPASDVHPRSAAIVAAVRACVGTRFRPQGRLRGVALDCIGVALIAAEAAQARLAAPAYALGGDHEMRLDAALAATSCVAVADPAPGDLLVLAPSPQRRHLAIVTDCGIVHAHAGLGRVVEGPVEPAWVVLGVWRFPQE